MTSSTTPRSWPYQALAIERDGPVVTVRMARPEKGNAVDPELHRALAEVWAHVAEDPEVRAVVLAGSPGAFCAGGDLGWLQELAVDGFARRQALSEGRRLISELLSCPLPVVAAVDGPAVGLGASLVTLSDIALLSEGAFLADPHVAIGLVAGDGGAAVWPVLASLLRVREHLFLGDRIPAARAVELGLASRVVTEGDVEEEARRLAHRLAELPPQAVQGTKRALNVHLEQAVAAVAPAAFAAESESFGTSEHQNLVAAMVSRTR